MDDEDLKTFREDFERGEKRQRVYNFLLGLIDLLLVISLAIYIFVSSSK
jgi:hypothetical protein